MKLLGESKYERLEFLEDGRIRQILCELRKSRRTRRVRLRLKSAEFALLTFPITMSWKAANQFLQNHLDWLQSKSNELPQSISLDEHFAQGGSICLGPMGRERKVDLKIDPLADGSRVSLENQQITIMVSSEGNKEALVKGACQKLAHQFLPGWLHWAEEITGLESKKLRIGDQKTRWGSCSHLGTISLNWRILLLPRELGDYLIYHELAHLVEMNHSCRFWSTLQDFVPDAREKDRMLSREGKKIFSLGRSAG